MKIEMPNIHNMTKDEDNALMTLFPQYYERVILSSPTHVNDNNQIEFNSIDFDIINELKNKSLVHLENNGSVWAITMLGIYDIFRILGVQTNVFGTALQV
jgi:hypothetical protein